MQNCLKTSHAICYKSCNPTKNDNKNTAAWSNGRFMKWSETCQMVAITID